MSDHSTRFSTVGSVGNPSVWNNHVTGWKGAVRYSRLDGPDSIIRLDVVSKTRLP